MANGPFDEYLSAPAFNPPRQQLSGFGGAPEAVMHFATEFLRGASQARARKYMESEQARSRNIDALRGLMQYAQTTGLPPQALQQFNSMVGQRMLAEVAGADNGAKGKEQGGNPLFGLVKNIATNMMGGQVPKMKPISEEEIGGMWAQLNSAVSGHQELKTKVSQQITDAFQQVYNKNGGVVSKQDLIANPQFMQALDLAQQSGVELPPTVQMTLQGVSTPEEIRLHRANAVLASLGGQQQAGQPQTATVANRPVYETAGQIASIGEPPSIPRAQGPAPQGNPVQQFAQTSGQAQMPAVLGDVVPMTPDVQHALSVYKNKPEEYFLFKGPGQSYAVLDYGVLPNGGKLVIDKQTGRRVNTEAARAQGFQSINSLPQEAVMMTPDRVEAGRKAIMTRIESSPVLSKRDQEAALKMFDAQVASGDFKGAADSVERLISDRERAAERNQRDEENRAARQERLGLLQGIQAQNQAMRFTSALENKVPLKNYDTVSQYADVMEQGLLQSRQLDNKARGVAQLNIIRGAAKITDPPSTVREGEQQSFTDAQGFFNKWITILEGGWRTGAVLSPEAERQFVNMARTLRAIHRRHAADAIGPTLRQAKAAGIDYQQILRESLWDVGEAVFSAGSQPPKPPARSDNPYAPAPGGGGSGKPKGF